MLRWIGQLENRISLSYYHVTKVYLLLINITDLMSVFLGVRFRWNTMGRLEKVFLKNNVMALISNVSLAAS